MLFCHCSASASGARPRAKRDHKEQLSVEQTCRALNCRRTSLRRCESYQSFRRLPMNHVGRRLLQVAAISLPIALGSAVATAQGGGTGSQEWSTDTVSAS